MNSKFLIFLGIIFLFTVHTQNVNAVNSIDWTFNGFPFGSDTPPYDFTLGMEHGNIANSFPISVLVNATDEEDFTTNGLIDTIDVLITSNENPLGVNYTLTETGINDGIFTGTSFIFLWGDFQYKISDVVSISSIDHPSSGCDSDNEITKLDSRSGGTSDGVIVKSETDLSGVGIVLTETGPNTCVFVGEIKFSSESSSEESGTLQVSEGDILAFENQNLFGIQSAQIIPNVDGKGSIIVSPDSPDDPNTAEVAASYNGMSSRVDMDPGCCIPGSGGGGPIANPGLVLNFIRSLLGSGGDPSEPPTLGVDKNKKRIVENGFSFNGNATNVEEFYTPYPLITTEVGKLNTIKLKIYENMGTDNIAHVGLSYGLGKGEIFNEGRATIEYDRSFDGKESVTLFDPEDVLGHVNVTTTKTDCSSANNAQCLEITFEHIFRESLEFNMVATNIWDFERRGWQNYFNHGIEITGDSMNPPNEYYGIYKGQTYKLTESEKNTATDEDGNIWTFNKIWKRNFISSEKPERDLMNPIKLDAIKKLGFDYSDAQEIFGYSRTDNKFSENKNLELIEAQQILEGICPECNNKSFKKLDEAFSYDFPERYSKLDDPEIKFLVNIENQKAQQFLKNFFDKIYPGKILD